MSMQSGWVRVNRNSPCPVCRKADWCAVSADGRLARCQRVEQGAYKTARDKSGVTYYLHRLGGDVRPAEEVERPAGKAAVRRADADTLNAVYTAFLRVLSLSDRHRGQLRQRGLPDDEIDRRMYRTLPAKDRPRLARLVASCGHNRSTLLSVPGFHVREGAGGRRYATIAGAPGLLVPVRDQAGRIVALKVRSDGGKEELEAKGLPRYTYISSTKYGGPGPGSPAHVPLGMTAPCQRVRLTEGELKADVAYLRSGVPTISVSGVASWRSALPVLRHMGASVAPVAFDMDASAKAEVAGPLAECVEGLTAEGLTVELERWDAAHKGIDDALAAGLAVEVVPSGEVHKVIAEVVTAAASAAAESGKGAGPPAAAGASHPSPAPAVSYKVSAGKIVHLRNTKDGPVEVPLCNFAARIVEQVMIDDGAEKSVRLVIEGALDDGTPLPRAEVRAENFPRLEWIIPAWGSRAVVYAGMSTRDNLRCALQLLSANVPCRTVYGHTGWREVGGKWLYLHAGGAIGASGPAADIDVSLPDVLANFVLPPPPIGEQLRRAVRASLAVLDLAPDHVTVPLLATAYRAPLGFGDLTTWVMGPTGERKSEAAALAQQHYGPAMVRQRLPANWSSTENSLEATAFAAKDALLVVDDFAPAGGAGDVARLHLKAERLLRAQGNASGRGRMRRDATLPPARPPRGIILGTGEDVPRGQSIRARLLVVEVGKGEVNLARLTACQQDAASGLYAQAMAGYVRWLAGRYGDLRAGLPGEHAQLRARAAGQGQHARTPGAVADLALGWKHLVDYAEAAGAIDAARKNDLWGRGWDTLLRLGAAQVENVAGADPAGQFLRLLTAALVSGRAHLAAPDGEHPENASAWGWRRENGNGGPGWRPQGRRAGWVDGDDVLLEPEAGYAAAQEMAREQGEALTTTPRTLWKRLHEARKLAGRDERRQRYTVRRTLQGVKHREVLHLRAAALYPSEEPSEPSADGGAGGEWTVSVDGPAAAGETVHQKSPENSGKNAGCGRNGRNGRSPGGDEGRGGEKQLSYIADGLRDGDVRTPFDEGNGHE